MAAKESPRRQREQPRSISRCRAASNFSFFPPNANDRSMAGGIVHRDESVGRVVGVALWRPAVGHDLLHSSSGFALDDRNRIHAAQNAAKTRDIPGEKCRFAAALCLRIARVVECFAQPKKRFAVERMIEAGCVRRGRVCAHTRVCQQGAIAAARRISAHFCVTALANTHSQDLIYTPARPRAGDRSRISLVRRKNVPQR